MTSRGDVRTDGRIFRGMNGERESWLSPEAWKRMQDRAAVAHQKLKKIRLENKSIGDAHRKYMANHMKNRRILDPIPFMLVGAKHRAKKGSLPFSIYRDDVGELPKLCPVLGIPIKVGIGKMKDGSPTIDRIHNNLGYIPGNVVIVSHKANRIKSNTTMVELELILKFYQRISRTQPRRRQRLEL